MIRTRPLLTSLFATLLLTGCLQNLSEYELPSNADAGSDSSQDRPDQPGDGGGGDDAGPTDSGDGPDLRMDPDVTIPDGCVPQTDEDFCANYRAFCGTYSNVDNCGLQREADCGTCVAPEVCGAETENLCDCPTPTDDEFCTANGAECGFFTETDRCGVVTTVDCGSCMPGSQCVANSCECVPQTAPELCAEAGRNCGTATLTDRCMTTREVQCGTCMSPETCGGAGTVGECGCSDDRTDEQFCADYLASCGQLIAVDDCGQSRTAMCGSCSQGTCNQNKCDCAQQSDAQFCAEQGAECGTVSGTDACSNPRTTDCGECTGGDQCDELTNTCKPCDPESDAEFCGRLGIACGPYTGTDNCGDPRTVTSCGACTGTGEECGTGDPIPANTCECITETTPAFCSRVGSSCGLTTAPDNCGVSTSRSCGTCGSGKMCSNNACVCAPETDLDFCTRLNACGETTATDNCGDQRTVTCPMCSDGNCVQGVCETCVPQTRGQFCTAQSVQCGMASGTDNCGDPRTEQCGNCGGDPSAAVCNSGTCCTLQTDASFCQDEAAECGAVSGTDNCGVSRDVTSCGTCGTNEVCNGNNRCECVPETDQELCTQNGFECSATVTDRCGNVREVSCGTCPPLNGCRSGRCVFLG